ncbi:hypothetical protein MSAN_01081200 [Mycena sanguinolenta]|uniref:NACHT domain-containing protein n=1 Tax=Mycena sanguinolenta TaxID=230812 RepID=A0A8H6YSW0_9AGAR|nr:hypothetical protein MSAN_01081200 [Mycena sanguinolenta]
MNNNFGGGTGGAGGESHGNSIGGRGGKGIGASLNCDIRVRDGNFVMNNAYDCGERGIDILHRSVAVEAIHDSLESYPQPKCHPGTRTKMLQDLHGWALNTHTKTSILWLYGPAGAGKSAIMQTVACQLQDVGRLGASFFFKRSHTTRGNARTLFSTIAYQLALSVPWLRTPISQTVEDNPSILVRSLEIQIKELIMKPCGRHGLSDSIAILIDGLDECDGHDVQREILRTIRNLFSPTNTISLRFIVASRPELHIREVLESSFYSGHYRSLNVEQSFDDVREYLSNELARIHREHDTMTNVLLPWPSLHILQELVYKSSGHFIYASTIIKFIDDKNYRPTQRLAMVQDLESTGSESAFEALDQLYMTILSSAARQSELLPILCAIVKFKLCPEDIDRLFRFAEGETRLLLRSLHSVLEIPLKADGVSIPSHISSHHASFLDFLNNPGRSWTFCVGTLHHRINLARIILETYVEPVKKLDEFLKGFIKDHFMSFITSLPTSTEVAELLPLIGTIDPDCIFGFLATDIPGRMLAWLKKILSAPRDLIKLWEDYEYMASFEKAMLWGSYTHPCEQHIFPCSPEFLRILVSLILQPGHLYGLPKLCDRLDLTWTEMRSFICSSSSHIGKDQHGPPVFAFRLAFRDVALQYIRKMVKNQLNVGGEVYSWESRDGALASIGKRRMDDDATGKQTEQWVAHMRDQCELVDGITYLVRLSPPCLALYRELWSIPLVPMGSSTSSPYVGRLIFHVTKWLESFPDPPMELIAFWKQIMSYRQPNSILNGPNYSLSMAEEGLTQTVTRWNERITVIYTN